MASAKGDVARFPAQIDLLKLEYAGEAPNHTRFAFGAA